jgi:hypothetical protein
MRGEGRPQETAGNRTTGARLARNGRAPTVRRPDRSLGSGVVAWHKRVSPGAGRGGWRDDFPLDPELPDHLVVDLEALREPIHPMFALRCRAFVDWHRDNGRNVEVLPPTDAVARSITDALALDERSSAEEMSDVILPITPLMEYQDVEDAALRTREILEYQLPDVSPLEAAAFMAVSDLVGGVALCLHRRWFLLAHCRGREELSDGSDRFQGVGPGMQ